jgi:ABC-type nitrate/sulfonate/bicarbonate transport system substrate-binding protein
MVKYLTFPLLTILTATGLSLLGSQRPAEMELKVAVNTTTIESFPVFLAAESFAAANKGYRVQLVPTRNGRDAMAQLLSGAVDAATGSETQVLLNSVADPRLRIAVTLADCRYRIVARRSAGIKRISDLKGKKVAATVNTSSLYYLVAMLRKADIKESEVQFVNLEGPDMPAALKNGTVDAVAIWEPHAQNSIEILGKDAMVFEDATVYREHFGLNTRTDVLADRARRTTLTRFLGAILEASTRLSSHSKQVIPSLAPKVGLTEKTVQAVWPQFRFPASLPETLEPTMTDVELWVAATQQRQPRPRKELATLLDGQPLAEAQLRSGNFLVRPGNQPDFGR